MIIGSRVADAFDHLEKDDPDGAMFAICAAIEATAAKEYGQGGRSTYKKFVHDNLRVITRVGLGIYIHNLNVAISHPEVPTDANGLCSFQDVMYHAVRCSLYHEAALPSVISFQKERVLHASGGHIVLPSSLIYGLVMSVVIAPVNAAEQSPKINIFNIPEFGPLPVNQMWGRRAEVLWFLGAVDSMNQLYEHSRAARTAPELPPTEYHTDSP